jgi:hypothetical protein
MAKKYNHRSPFSGALLSPARNKTNRNSKPERTDSKKYLEAFFVIE